MLAFYGIKVFIILIMIAIPTLVGDENYTGCIWK